LEAFLLSHETTLRLGGFLAILGIMAVWELKAPRRVLRERKALRWANNLALAALNAALVRMAFPVAAVGVAAFAADRGVGFFNVVHLPYPLAILLSLLALDLVIYLQHRMFHAVPLLWRAHRMHHADLDIDVTSGSRFHPFEIGLSLLIKCAVILALGPPAVAVLAFEVLLNASSMFNHGNVCVPQSIERHLRRFVVTPDMHRVHHSIERRETNSNFGFNLAWWDRLFGTYRAEPQAGHEGMTIGIALFRSPRELELNRMLLQPFRADDGAYAGRWTVREEDRERGRCSRR
jgi:sterol desaturase/sphingolipid hydroxylase (fatty acid hydroxylase superfamily)